DDDFLADARDVDHPPLLAGPGSADATPARAVGIVLALRVPMELDFHATVLVGEDFLPGRTDHHRRLSSLYHRLGGRPLGSKRQSHRNAGEVVLIHKLRAFRPVTAHFGGMANSSEH